MSGWALALRRDGRPIDRALFASMLLRLAHRGPDGQDCAFLGSLAMGHLHFWTTPEEAGERQPLCGGPSSIDLVFDGRLDNRDELVDQLGDDRQELRQASDAELVRRAFRLWGDDCFDRFEGPFALALRDRVGGRVVCARDGLGERSLSYFLSESLLLVASEESAILAHPSVGKRTDATSIARFFAFQGPEEGQTYFADVRELPPAHVLSVEGDRSWLRRYWELDPGARLAYRREEEYAEHFAELLRRSVGSQLRSASAPAILLSGGLDSASVAALAGRELRQRGSGVARAVSWTFDQLQECDEREWIDPVVERSALESVHLPCDDGWPLAGGVEAWPRSPNIPFNNPFRLLLNRGYEAVAAAGGRVVLSGWFGDNLYHGREQWLADLLGEWRWLEVCRASVRAARLRGEALRHGLIPGLRYWAGTVLGGRRLRRSSRRKPESSWLTPWARDLLGQEGGARFGPKGRDLRRGRILNSFEIVAAREETAFASPAGVEHRYPYWSRPLVQFALSLPSHLLYRPGSEKHILRIAMKNLLPESVRLRQGHRVLERLFFESIANRARESVRRLLERDNCQWLRYVDRDRVRSTLSRLVHGDQIRGIDSVVLWQCVSFELWRGPLAADGGLQ